MAARPRTCWSRRAASTGRATCARFATPTWAFPIATAACPTTSSSPRRCSRAAPATRQRSPPRWTRSAQARDEPAANNRTGGSTFKNPPGRKAWQLIDAAGCRGLTVGDAQVSELHCNFLINLGGASAADIETLGETVRERVKAHSGVELEWEIKRIGIAVMAGA